MIDIRIAVECYGDTLFIEKLLDEKVNHIKGNGGLRKFFERTNLQDSIIVGITDFDKDTASVFKSLNLKPIAGKDFGNIKAFKREGKRHYLIFINPALERFLMNCCNEVTGFQFPAFTSDLDELKRKTKKLNVETDIELIQLVDNLKLKQSASIVHLKNLINEFLSFRALP